MPKRIDDKEIIEQLKWIKSLPNEGGAWGESILQLGENIVGELEQLTAKKADIDSEIRQKRNFLRSLTKRADKEAPMLYDVESIAQAKPESTDEEYEDVDEQGDADAAQ